MTVTVALEHRFQRLPDGSVWTRGNFRHSFWHRYLAVFDSVRCIARLRPVTELDGEWHRADGEGVSFVPFPYYTGLLGFARNAPAICRAVGDAVQRGDACILRVPGLLGTIAWRRLSRSGYPYGVEVIGDPYDMFAPGAVRHPLRPYIRWRSVEHLRRQCAGACAASYVTESALQRRYPTDAPSISASSIELRPQDFATHPRPARSVQRTARLIFVGSLEQPYKGPDVLLNAFARCLRELPQLELTILGTGRERAGLERLAARLGCSSRVSFKGHMPAGAAVRAELDGADLFVLPSRQEGVPRAMLEAMARGLPCIGSAIGGIPELLPAEALVPVGDSRALASRIREFLLDPSRMSAMSARNLDRARAYASHDLQQRREAFYRQLRAMTAASARPR